MPGGYHRGLDVKFDPRHKRDVQDSVLAVLRNQVRQLQNQLTLLQHIEDESSQQHNIDYRDSDEHEDNPFYQSPISAKSPQ